MTQSYHPPPAPIFNTLRRIRRSPGAASFTGCASEHAVFRQATRSSFRRSSRLLNDHFRFVVAGRSVSIGAQTKGGSGTRGQVPSSQPTSTVFLLPASRDDYTDDKRQQMPNTPQPPHAQFAESGSIHGRRGRRCSTCPPISPATNRQRLIARECHMFVQLHDFQSGPFTPATGDKVNNGTFAANEKYLKRHHQARVRGKRPAPHRVSRRERNGHLGHGKNGARAPPK